ncbi:MAG TPA: DoxX family protein [Chryseosolibacter sp.]|nr:DoxX family protein [Chryseosolibacter sp.]
MVKSIFCVNNAATATDAGILIARVGIGVFMLAHGYPKLQALLSDAPVEFRSVMGLSPTVSLTLAVFSEFFCSLLVIIGLATRLAVVPLAITMLVAALHVHGADPFSSKEKALLYLTVYLMLLLTGSGKFSLDALLYKRGGG